MKKAETTRMTILQKAFDMIYGSTYQTTSVDNILATTQVTKGAFYYHFKSKDEMGLAIIKEILEPNVVPVFESTLGNEPDPKKGIYQLMRHLLLGDPFLTIEHGCPVANLTQEMTPWHPEFSKALQQLTKRWTTALQDILEKGKQDGYIRKEVNAEQVTLFVISGYWGVRAVGKIGRDKEVYAAYLQELQNYLSSLQ